MNKKVIVSMSKDEWYPYYDIEQVEDGLDVREYNKCVEMSEENYIKYKGLLLQMEKLQTILDNMWDKS